MDFNTTEGPLWIPGGLLSTALLTLRGVTALRVIFVAGNAARLLILL